jgi:hypothetical protein
MHVSRCDLAAPAVSSQYGETTKQTSAVVPHPLTMATSRPISPFRYVGQDAKALRFKTKAELNRNQKFGQ